MRYTPENSAPNAQVLLDGFPVEGDFIMVDTDLGIAEIYARDENGKLVIENDNIKTEVLKGNYSVCLTF